ncbi:MAG: 50S ribosomal protein L28 [Alphaproteobacteria bacterium]|nr:50S ribosomal protein L28 [Alphaproteobacteria bacterium]
MARRCELSGVGPRSGNNVSHANNKTKRRFLPNLCDVTLHSDRLGRGFKMRIAASTLRSIDHMGGFDAYLTKADESVLSPTALKIKRELAKAAS